jgi:hypothetical protein
MIEMDILKLVVLLALWLTGIGAAFAQASMPGTYYVKESVLEERLAPSSTATITNRIYLRQKVEVFELEGGWARVSKYYNGSVEGKSSQVARWVRANGLSASQPKEPKQPEAFSDPRIEKDAIPRVGQGGLTARDIEVLRKGALKFLNSGRCSSIELADKSTSRANTYYVNCGGPNLFFTPSDL